MLIGVTLGLLWAILGKLRVPRWKSIPFILPLLFIACAEAKAAPPNKPIYVTNYVYFFSTNYVYFNQTNWVFTTTVQLQTNYVFNTNYVAYTNATPGVTNTIHTASTNYVQVNTTNTVNTTVQYTNTVIQLPSSTNLQVWGGITVKGLANGQVTTYDTNGTVTGHLP